MTEQDYNHSLNLTLTAVKMLAKFHTFNNTIDIRRSENIKMILGVNFTFEICQEINDRIKVNPSSLSSNKNGRCYNPTSFKLSTKYCNPIATKQRYSKNDIDFKQTEAV